MECEGGAENHHRAEFVINTHINNTPERTNQRVENVRGNTFGLFAAGKAIFVVSRGYFLPQESGLKVVKELFFWIFCPQKIWRVFLASA